MANVNSIPEKITYIVDEDCVPNNVVRDQGGRPLYNPDGTYQTSGPELLDPGPQASKNQGFSFRQQVTKSFLISAYNPDSLGGIGRLNKLHIRAVNTVLAKQLSGISYTFINPNSYLGKYQLGPETLVKLGYIKQNFFDTYGPLCVKNDSAWTGKDGVISLTGWFSSTGVQEKAHHAYTNANYLALSANEGIKNEDNL